MENYQNLLEKYIYSEVEIEQLEELYKTHQKEQKISNYNYEKNNELIDALLNAEMDIESLYKYCGVSKYTLENLEKEHIFLSPAKDLNDKFELNTFVDTTNTEYISDYTNFVENVISTIPDAKIVDYIKDFSFIENQYKDGARIGSLTQNKFSGSMWGTYADKYRGLMIEYDFIELLEEIYPKDKVNHNIILQLNKVIYSKEKPSGLLHHLLLNTYNRYSKYLMWTSLKNGFKNPEINDFLVKFILLTNLENFKFILRKDLSWKQEVEWRISKLYINNDKESCFVRAKAKAIYLGLDWAKNYENKYNKKYASEILEYCKSKNIKVYKMVKDSTNRHEYIYEEHKM